MGKNNNEKEVELFYGQNEFEIIQICAILEENDIPFIKQNDGIGSYMNLYMGQSSQGKRIFVDRTDYDKALELIAPFISKDIEEQEDDNNSGYKYEIIRKILGFLVIGIPLIGLFLSIIMGLINTYK